MQLIGLHLYPAIRPSQRQLSLHILEILDVHEILGTLRNETILSLLARRQSQAKDKPEGATLGLSLPYAHVTESRSHLSDPHGMHR